MLVHTAAAEEWFIHYVDSIPLLYKILQTNLFAPVLQFSCNLPRRVCHPPTRSALLYSTLSLDALQH